MRTITFTVGPPGAGKTRWAHEEIARRGLHEVQRVNFDDFFTMIAGRTHHDFSTDDFRLAQRMLVSAVRSIADSGRDVIIDNMHLSARFPDTIRDELGDVHEYRIKDFTGLPLAVCVKQDAARAVQNPHGHVGHDEVQRAYSKGQALRRRYGGEGLPLWEQELNRSDNIEPYKPDTSLPRAVLFDIDGTLALANSRGPYDTSRYHTDDVEHRLAGLLNNLRHSDEPTTIIGMTGRVEDHRAVTEAWLEDPGHVLWDELHMRPSGDQRRDDVVKLELFNKHVRHRFNVLGTFDDRDRVVRLWRRLGLLTLQCAYGDF